MVRIEPRAFVRSRGPRPATKKDLIARFDHLMKDNKGGIVDFPLRYIEDHALNDSLEPLRRNCDGLITDEELYKGAQLAKVGHLLDVGKEVTIPLTPGEKNLLKIQRSSAFWKEPKELLLTLFACSLASLTQGWDQAANGNLGWPSEFGISGHINQTNGRDTWIFGGINSIMWFSAAILGSYLSDPISEHIGRRGALFVAAICSFSSVIAASQTQSWQGLMGCRIILGLGIGGKASVVPILESEVTPSSKRGRLLVGWQVFVAAGLFCGYTASYILRDNWRHQVLSGAIPAFALLVFTWASCESPRWLIIQGKYEKAFTTLVRLRKERVLAAKELCSIYYQIQAERWLFSGKRDADEEEDSEDANPFMPELPRTSYFRRLINHYTFPRIRRAAIATMVVMLSQQLSGINIIALLATTFFTTGDLRISTPTESQIDSYKLAIGFGAANTIFSIIAYFLVENKEEQGTETEIGTNPGDDRSEADNSSQEGLPEIDGGRIDLSNCNDRGLPSRIVTPHRLSAIDAHVRFEQDDKSSSEVLDAKSTKPTSQHLEFSNPPSERSSIASVPDNHDSQSENDTLYEFESSSRQLRGRRFLLLVSLAGGMFTLLITSLCFNIPQSSPARLPLIALFIYVFTLFYSVGAGAIPFLYCAEVFPNEGREIGMSWSTFWNFSGAGLLTLFVPFGINWGHGKLLGIFSGFNALAFILVWFLVPSTNQTATLEDMSYIFGRKLRQHAKAQAKRLLPGSQVRGPRTQWLTALGNGQGGSVSTVEVGKKVALEVEEGAGIRVGEKGLGNGAVGQNMEIMADPDAIEPAAQKSKEV